jgi:hypothetical protein
MAVIWLGSEAVVKLVFRSSKVIIQSVDDRRVNSSLKGELLLEWGPHLERSRFLKDAMTDDDRAYDHLRRLSNFLGMWGEG